MIRNPNGTPYEPTGSLVQFDPNSPNNALYDLWDQDAIKIGGSPIYYFEVFIPSSTIDPTYTESRGKIWSQFPVQLYGLYEPIASTNEMGLFQIDSIGMEISIDFNRAATIAAIGHPPKIGSRIRTPHMQEDWELIQVNTAVFNQWNILHYQFICKKFQDDSINGPGKVRQPIQDIKII